MKLLFWYVDYSSAHIKWSGLLKFSIIKSVKVAEVPDRIFDFWSQKMKWGVFSRCFNPFFDDYYFIFCNFYDDLGHFYHISAWTIIHDECFVRCVKYYDQ